MSGKCPLGGIDLWAIEEAEHAGLLTEEFAPKNNAWDTGFKPRNIQIARASALVVCITVAKLPDTYRGRRFPLCYHCKTSDHVKSGGCWTMHYAESIGRRGKLWVIE